MTIELGKANVHKEEKGRKNSTKRGRDRFKKRSLSTSALRFPKPGLSR